MNVGDELISIRTITEEDIRLFGKLTGDVGVHHVEADTQGRLMAQGLLTASLPTKIGGDLNFVAREMTFRFVRPVYAGDMIECRVTLTDIREEPEFVNVSSQWTCVNQRGKEVMNGNAVGIVRR
jgi:acyl dehydratase